ncbi:MAG: hypothetical protein ACRDHP_15815, partial [Ktedonobacterales bacterium]
LGSARSAACSKAKGGQGTEWWGQMRAVPLPVLPGMSAADLHARLWEDYQVEVPITDWQGWRFVRVSIQAYNSEQDVERLVEGLAAALNIPVGS